MKIIILDGYTVIRDDMNWNFLEKFGDLTYYDRTSPEDIVGRIHDADIVITSKCRIDSHVIDDCPGLKYIGVIATGYNNIDVAYARKKGIAVTNVPAYSTDAVAQFTFALILEAINQVGIHNQSVHEGDWNRSLDFSYALSLQTELTDKTIGIIGYGNIGQKVSKIAESFGMNVLVYSSHVNLDHVNPDNDCDNTEFTDMKSVFSKSDIVTLHCALNETNEGMINARTIEAMKDGVVLVNTSRGQLINEEDLATALLNGKISFACLDVLAKEPPDADNPLLGIKNCIITPHIAWFTTEARQRILAVTEENIKSFFKGNRQNRVD